MGEGIRSRVCSQARFVIIVGETEALCNNPIHYQWFSLVEKPAVFSLAQKCSSKLCRTF